MASPNVALPDVVDLDDLPLDRRAEYLERLFRELAPNDVVWIAACGDSHHYAQFLHARFPGEVDWVDDFDLNGQWIARLSRK